MKRFRNLSTQLRNLFLILILAFGQAATAVGPFLQSQKAAAASVCINDTAGPNDEPGQKDLTKMCSDEAGLPTSLAITWNWDDTAWSGNNSGDACSLYDTDGDGNANFSLCVVVKGDPATYFSTRLYSCTADSRNDRCAGPTPITTFSSTCTAGVVADSQPFAAGDSAPDDTVATCTVVLADVGATDAELIDVCSYPSQEPNSDPSDCIVIQDRSGKLEVRKDLIPSNNSGLFNLQVDGVTKAPNVGDGGTTGEVIVPEGNHSVGETAGTNTSLAGYSPSIECRDLNGTGSVIASGTGATLAVVPIGDGADVVCIITNTASGSITIIKDTVPNDGTNFSFTTSTLPGGTFQLDDDSDPTLSNSKNFSGLVAGTYDVAETADPNYVTTSSCSDNSPINAIALSAGENITCTITNTKKGHLIVQKTTNPVGDPTVFSINTTGNGTITGGGAGTITDATDKDYEVTPGTYSVAETVPSGWAKTGDTCQNVVVAAGATVTCLITNTKYATLRIVKDALPDDPQDFGFTTTNLGGAVFSLDDDADVTLTNDRTFGSLLPGSYSVTEASLPGWSLTGLTCDTNNFTAVIPTVTVNLSAGQTTNCTFVNTKLVSISGTKYTSSATGSLGPVLAGWTIFIDANNNGILDNGELSTVTDVNGDYSFVDLMPGTFTLNEVLLAGWTQIFGPSTFSLTAGQTATDKDFGNFQNGGISGFKWNDINGNGVFDNGEPKLSGWTINLYRDSDDVDTIPEQLFASTVTDVNGNYSFTNLSPLPNRFYGVCEVQQANWTQTFPAANACHSIELDQSGETNTNTNFGNQGRGGIQVIKNVDTDGDGDIDVTGATDWTWDINGSGNFATGNTQNVAAGSYTVSEDQKANFHVTASSCTGEATPNTPTTTLSVTLSPGETVVCTFVNTRDTGTITVRKVLNPTNDPGLFNLQIDSQTAGTGANVGHGGGTGTIVVPTGTHSVSETAGTNTNLANYSSSYSCTNEVSGNGTATGNFSLTTGQNITCTFTNVRFAGIVVQKQTLPDGSPVSFAFNASYDADGFSLSDGQSNNSGNLLPGDYSVSEVVPNGWDLSTPVICSDQSPAGVISLQAGETVTCVFTNTQRGSISGTKYEVNAGETAGTAGNELSGWTIFIDANSNGVLNDGEVSDVTDINGDYSFGDLVPGAYRVCEVLQATWTQIFPTGQTNCYALTVDPGENEINKDFGNFKNGSISGYKFNDLDGDGNFETGEPKLAGWTIYLDTNSNSTLDIGETSTTTDVNGNYSFTNLVPATYRVCEVPQTGYTQTSTPTCYSIEINQSNENNEAVFGNQGRGSITVVKNVDTDGDGDIDVSGATDWTWDLNGNYYTDNNIATGSLRSNIPADTYTINEDQKANFHFVSVVCTGEAELAQSETVTVTLSPGENITCTFVNARDTGRIIVQKELDPQDDTGVFDLRVGDTTVVTNAGHGDNGSLQVVTGSYTVSELAGLATNLADYDSSVSCTSESGVAADDDTDVVVSVGTDEVWTCVFTNTRLGSITIVKDAQPDSTQAFTFTGNLTGEEEPNFTLTDDGINTTLASRSFTRLLPGTYNATEPPIVGWDLDQINCSSEEDVDVNNQNVVIDLQPGENVTCTFVNIGRSNVIVTKYNDLNRNGQFDPDEPTLPEPSFPGWTISLDDLQQVTGADGSTTFTNVKPNQLYGVDEVQQDGWTLSDITCDADFNQDITFGDRLAQEIDLIELPNGHLIFPRPGQTVNCFIGNYQDLVLNIAKANDRPNPTTVGDTVTYTLLVSVPTNSGVSYGTVTEDLPPENFTYVPGSWAAVSNVRGDLKAAGITTQPTYASPGTWILGTMIPGEVVTLTYRAVIGTIVSAGTYPDVAFAQGCGLPADPCIDEEVVFSNLSFAAEPFVSTAVTIVSPQVLGANTTRTVLVNTGTTGMIASVMAATALLGVTIIVAKRRPTMKGGRK
ncbi:MAG: SdrD B-like domain-containing protein [Patescibacteria group bacterium]